MDYDNEPDIPSRQVTEWMTLADRYKAERDEAQAEADRLRTDVEKLTEQRDDAVRDKVDILAANERISDALTSAREHLDQARVYFQSKDANVFDDLIAAREEVQRLRKYNENQRLQLQDARAQPRAERDAALEKVAALESALLTIETGGPGLDADALRRIASRALLACE